MEDDRREFKCKSCTYVAKTNTRLERHMRKHTGEKPYKCLICGKVFSYQTNCKRHELIHGEKRFECDICSVKFTLKSSLRTHMRIHTGEDLFQCNLCDKKYTFNSLLQAHLRSHSGERPFKCSTCDKSFFNSCDCKVHELLHKNETFCCNICSKSFGHERNLKKHMLIHSSVKPYSCSVCGKQFTKKHFLKRHEVVHTGEERFKCAECGQSFSKKHSLESHMQWKHESEGRDVERPFQCSFCKKTFTTKRSCKQHLINFHTSVKSLEPIEEVCVDAGSVCKDQIRVDGTGFANQGENDPLEKNEAEIAKIFTENKILVKEEFTACTSSNYMNVYVSETSTVDNKDFKYKEDYFCDEKGLIESHIIKEEMCESLDII